MATPTDPEMPTLGQILDLGLRRDYPPDIYGTHPDYWTEHLVREVFWLLEWCIMVWKNRFCRDALIERRELRHVIRAEAERPGEDKGGVWILVIYLLQGMTGSKSTRPDPLNRGRIWFWCY